MTKRVVQFCGSFNQGGTERQTLSLTKDLIERSHFEVYAATLNSTGPLADKFNELDLPPIPEFPLTSFFSAGFLSKVRECAVWLKQSRIDLVHTHDFYTNVFGMAAATLAGVPVRIASKRETYSMRSRAQTQVERLAYGRAHGIVANAAAVEKHLIKLGVPAQKIHVIYNAIDIDDIGIRVNDVSGIPSGRRLITVVANLRHEVKNIPLILAAFSTIAERFADVDLVVAGEGLLKQGLQDQASKLGVGGRAHFIGRCEDVGSLLKMSEIGVLTSDAEGFSNSILEYMAAGLPVIATDVGGAREAVIDGETGFTIPPGDADLLAANLVKLLSDRELAARLGANGKARAISEFSSDVRLKAIIDLYERSI